VEALHDTGSSHAVRQALRSGYVGSGIPRGLASTLALEVIAMTAAMHIKARITPWDDTAFVKAFEHARDVVHEAEAGADGEIDGTRAGEQVQHMLREAGYPNARVDVIQSVDEKLEHTSHWLVNRDG
jgi:hypothetical protein